ncbi:MAG: hypothetical protein ACLR7Z_07755 [Bilophila wadsworthia]
MNIEYAAKELMKKRDDVAFAKAVGIHPVTLCRLCSAQKAMSAYDKLLTFS